MRFLVAFLFIAVGASASELPRTLQDFETDGCTMFIEGPASKPDLWAHCCFEHDLRYWFGGTSADKKYSDKKLKECVKEVAGSFWANLMYNGVRLGSLSPIKFKYVWGWAWTPKRGKTKLTMEELDYIIQRLFETDLDPQYREQFIATYLSDQYQIDLQNFIASPEYDEYK